MCVVAAQSPITALNLCTFQPLNDVQLVRLRQNLLQGRPRLGFVTIDEISFAVPWQLAGVDARLKQVTGVQADFGGVSVWILGDFYQLPPVGAKAFYDVALQPGSRGSEMDRRGLELFLKFRRRALSEQVRCEDPDHTSVCDAFRRGDTAGLRNYLAAHLLRACDAEEFACAQLITPGNPERNHLNPIILSEFAAARGERVVSWRLKATFQGTEMPLARTLDQLGNASSSLGNVAAGLNPELTGHFCPGAPMFFLKNINPLRQLANGSAGVLHSLQFPSEDVRADALQFLAANAGDVMLPPGLEPSAVLAAPTLKDEVRAAWPAELTLVPGDVVIPVNMAKLAKKITAGTRTITVTIESAQYDLSFVSTIHKAQGLTLRRVIMSLLNRPGKPSREDFHALYVLLTRVKRGSDFRVLADLVDLYFGTLVAPCGAVGVRGGIRG